MAKPQVISERRERRTWGEAPADTHLGEVHYATAVIAEYKSLMLRNARGQGMP